MNREPRAEDFIYRMPSVEEVVKAGYPADYHETVRRERDAFIARFNAEPDFRAAEIAKYLQQKEERRAQRRRDQGGER